MQEPTKIRRWTAKKQLKARHENSQNRDYKNISDNNE